MPWPTTHGVRRLERQATVGRLDDEAQAAVDELVSHYAEDAGGVALMTNRELSVLRDVAVCDLIIAEAFKYAHARGEIIDAEGKLIAVLGKNLLAYLNTKRRGLEALGLRPDRAEKVPTLETYLAQRHQAAAPVSPPSAAAAPAAGGETAVAEESDR